ncbi:hypothetical protein ACLQ2D_33965 [Streptomyces sp. DT199]
MASFRARSRGRFAQHSPATGSYAMIHPTINNGSGGLSLVTWAAIT